MVVKKDKKSEIIKLVIALVLVVGGSVLFAGAIGGWFGGGKIVLDAEYYCTDDCGERMVTLGQEEYNKLIDERKSFIVFVDQGGCRTADNLRGFILKWAEENGVKVYKMMFNDMKETSLHDTVKYYPSVAIIAQGKVAAFLRADSDEDADAYNNYDKFVEWMKKKL